MKARFTGDPLDNNSGPRSITMFGVTFRKGAWSPVPAEIEAKISCNSHFETAADDAKVSDATAAEVEDAAHAKTNPPDQDGDGESGGSTSSPEKDELIAKLEALAERGAAKGVEVKFDRRLGVPKLKAILEAAEFEIGEE